MQKISHITTLAKPISRHAHSKNSQSSFNLHEFVPTCKNSVNFMCSLLRYGQF